MSTGTFGAGLDRLEHSVGHGKLVGTCEVDQVYAKYQHEHPEFKHPDGGKAFYLRDPLFEKSDENMRTLASKVLAVDGDGIKGGMRDVAERLSTAVYEQAPWEFADLRASGHPKVTDDGAVWYDRAPRVHRLDDEELRIKRDLRDLFEPDRYRRS